MDCILLPCGHGAYHRRCIPGNTKRCPVCSKTITAISLLPEAYPPHDLPALDDLRDPIRQLINEELSQSLKSLCAPAAAMTCVLCDGNSVSESGQPQLVVFGACGHGGMCSDCVKVWNVCRRAPCNCVAIGVKLFFTK
jgi:hypothetical protein